MSEPLVTVICICYNHENFVLESLESVINQSYKNIELIIVDNGSIDKSEKKIETFISKNPFVKFIQLKNTLSHTVTFNLAFKQSSGTFLIDLSADDKLLPYCIEKQIKFFLKQTKDVGLIYGNAYHIDEKGTLLNPYFKVDPQQKVLNKNLFQTNYISILKGGLCMCSVASMFTRKHFELLNGYNENLFYEDLDYWLRLSYTYKIAFLDAILVEKRFSASSLGNQFYKKDVFSRKINKSLRLIYKQAIKRNNKTENRALLKRIHYSMEKSYYSKNWFDLIKFSVIELQNRLNLF